MHVSVKRFLERLEGKHSHNFEEFPNEGKVYYAYDMFFVDDTAIACFTKDKNGEKVLLMSSEALSPHITPYLPEIESFSKINPKNIYKLPQARYGSELYHCFDDVGVNAIFAHKLETLQKDMDKHGKTVYKCSQYIKYFAIYDNLRTNVMLDLEDVKSWKAYSDKCLQHMNEVDKVVEEFKSKHTLRELVDIAFFNGDVDGEAVDENFRSLLRSSMSSSGDLSYLKVMDDGNCYTPDLDPDGNYRLIMSNEDTIAVGEAVLNGTIRHGMKFGDFTVMSKRDNWIKISCNKYTPEMLLAVREDCMKFNEKKS